MSGDRISFKCSKCGSSKFDIPTNPKPNDVITCAGCGATGRYDDIKTKATELAKAEVERKLRDAFKGFGEK